MDTPDIPYLKRLPPCFLHTHEDEDDGREADGRVQPVRSAVADGVAKLRKRFDRQDELQIR